MSEKEEERKKERIMPLIVALTCATQHAGARTSLGPIGQFIQKFKMQGTPCPIFLLNS